MTEETHPLGRKRTVELPKSERVRLLEEDLEAYRKYWDDLSKNVPEYKEREHVFKQFKPIRGNGK